MAFMLTALGELGSKTRLGFWPRCDLTADLLWCPGGNSPRLKVTGDAAMAVAAMEHKGAGAEPQPEPEEDGAQGSSKPGP